VTDSKRRRWILWLLFIAAAICALLYLRCSGYGFGGSGDDSASSRPKPKPRAPTTAPQPLVGTPSADAAPPRCKVRVDKTGVSIGGEAVEIAEVAGRCGAGVELTVTGDARYGDAEALREALKTAGIDLLDRSL
jgi:hypothetical protein